MKEKIIPFIKEITKEIIVALIVAVILALFGLIPFTRPYFLKLFSFIITHLKEIILLFLLIFSFYFYYKVRRLSSTYNSLKKDIVSFPKIPTVDKTPDLVKKIEEIKSVTLTIKSRLSDLEMDIYPINRFYLYKEAEKHQKLEQRGALLCRLNIIDLDIKKDNNYNLEESLDDLFSYVRNKHGFSAQDLSDIKNCLNKVKNEGHKEIVEQILAQVKSDLV